MAICNFVNTASPFYHRPKGKSFHSTKGVDRQRLAEFYGGLEVVGPHAEVGHYIEQVYQIWLKLCQIGTKWDKFICDF